MNFKIIAISGDGNGAGKSTLAASLVGKDRIVSLAAIMREELTAKYPHYEWFNKDQKYKESTPVIEEDRKTVRQVLIDYGQARCVTDKWYWVRALAFKVRDTMSDGVYAIDDLRKIVEIDFLRGFFGPESVCHIHVGYSQAKVETLYDNDKLRAIPDYLFPRPEAAQAPLTVPAFYTWFRVGANRKEASTPYFVSRELAEKWDEQSSSEIEGSLWRGRPKEFEVGLCDSDGVRIP